MPKKSSKPVKQQIEELKVQIACLQDDIQMQQVYENMPKTGIDSEHYSYIVSKRSIANLAVENWLRAVIKHINERITNPIRVELIPLPKATASKEAKLKLLRMEAIKYGLDVDITEKK